MKPLGVFLAVTFAAAPLAGYPEGWECKDLMGSWDKVLVTAVVNDDRQSGQIFVAGVTHDAAYSVEGFDRRWSFGLTSVGSSYKYAFVIRPDGKGLYYDFQGGDTAKPSEFMDCRKRTVPFQRPQD